VKNTNCGSPQETKFPVLSMSGHTHTLSDCNAYIDDSYPIAYEHPYKLYPLDFL